MYLPLLPVFLCATLAEASQDEQPLQLMLYDVKDLEELGQSPAPPGPVREETLTFPLPAMEPFKDWIQAFLSPASSVGLQNGIMIVRATEVEHKVIHAMAGLARRRAELKVSITVRQLEGAENLFGRRTTTTIVSSHSGEAGAVILKTFEDHRKERLVNLPRLTTRSGQKNHLGRLERTEYTKAFKMDEDTTGASIVSPVMDTAVTGYSLGLCPVILSVFRKKILFEGCKLVLSEARSRPFPKVETALGRVEDPQVQSKEFTFNTSFQEGDVLLIGPLTKPWSGKEGPKAWFLVSCQIAELQEFEKTK